MKFKKLISLIMSAVMVVMLCSTAVFAAKKGIALNKTSASVTVGKSITLKPTVTGVKNYTLQWSTSDKTIATVTKSGKVTGVKAGSITVTVKIKDTKYKASCKVTVKKSASSGSDTAKNTISSSGDALDFVKNIKIGWNLGNTLDCTGSWINGDLAHETAWGNPKTTEDMIKAVKKAGFNAVRIPTSWGEHLDSKNNISKEWLDRVQTVVDYAYKNDMYVILNTHHEGWWFVPSKDSKETSERFTSIWKQISERFKDYDEHLIFEGLNEPRTEGSAKEWSGGTAEERKVINKYNRLFVETVRKSGGNNKLRYLMITPYAANCDGAAINELEVPDDSRIIISVHAYLPYDMALNTGSTVSTFTDNDKNVIDSMLKGLSDKFISKGIPVIIGESGSLNKKNDDERAKLAKYYVSAAKKAGIPLFWWDNGNDSSSGEAFLLLNRKTAKMEHDKIVKALMEGLK